MSRAEAGDARAVRIIGCSVCVSEEDPRLRRWRAVGDDDLYCPAPGCGRSLADGDWLALSFALSPAPTRVFSATAK